MKKIFLNTSLLLLLLLYGSVELTANTYSSKTEFTKSINKEFDISSSGNVEMSNRHGKVEIKTWDNNKVKIDITITVNARNEAAAQKVFDRINIDFSNSQNHVSAETSIESKPKSWSWWGSGNNHDYTIDYKVYMPKTCDLFVQNKYGNTYVQALDASAEISVGYGDIRMDDVRDKLKIKLKYGNATIANAGEVELEIKHAKIRLKKIKDISLQSKYSTVNIEEAKDIKSTSKYDTYNFGSIHDFRNQGKYDNIDIGSAENLNVITKYTDLRIKYLENSCNFDFGYGGAKIEEMGQNFSEIRIEGAYADFKVGIPSSATYKLDAIGKYSGIRFPDDLDIFYEKEKGSMHELVAYKGPKTVSNLIKARLRYGGLKLIRL